MKKKIILLSSIFVVFLALGIWLHTQRGVYYADKFWHTDGARAYIAMNGDRVAYDEDGGAFDLILGGKQTTAVARKSADTTEIAFSDGWTAVLRSENYPDLPAVFYDADEIILDDMSRMGLSFYASAYWESGAGQKTVTLKNGAAFSPDVWDPDEIRYENERGEVLRNPGDLLYVTAGGATQERTWFARFLSGLPDTRPTLRGEPWVVFLYALIFGMAAFSYLCPDKATFLGSRWRFEGEPKLSEAGVQAQQISAIVVMGLSILLLFMPLLAQGL